MKYLFLLCAMVGPAWSQSVDFSSLDKLAAKAKNVTRVSLDRDQLKAALSLLSTSDNASAKNMDGVRKLVESLTGVEVRNFEFDRSGAYHDSDLAPIRQQMSRLKDWSKIVDSKEDGEHSEIFLHTVDGKTAGIGIIAAEQNEVSVVLLKGSPNLKDLGGLGGVMGLPAMSMGPRTPSASPEPK